MVSHPSRKVPSGRPEVPESPRQYTKSVTRDNQSATPDLLFAQRHLTLPEGATFGDAVVLSLVVTYSLAVSTGKSWELAASTASRSPVFALPKYLPGRLTAPCQLQADRQCQGARHDEAAPLGCFSQCEFMRDLPKLAFGSLAFDVPRQDCVKRLLRSLSGGF
jgi:hypothetical protein